MKNEKKKPTDRIQFAYYAYVQGPLGDVFTYLLRNTAHSKYKGKKMGLSAISAFWKPFSARTVLKLSEPEVTAIAISSIHELEKQIELIRATFNIQEKKKLSTLTQHDVEKLIDQRLRVIQGGSIHNSPTSSPQVNNYSVSR